MLSPSIQNPKKKFDFLVLELNTSRAEIIVVIIIPCRRDAILITQRFVDIKFGMVAIDKVKVRLLPLVWAYVSPTLQSVQLR